MKQFINPQEFFIILEKTFTLTVYPEGLLYGKVSHAKEQRQAMFS